MKQLLRMSSGQNILKTSIRFFFAIAPLVSICGLPLGDSAKAQIVGINVVNSSVAIKFDDTNSLNGGNPGNLYSQISSTWTGTVWSLSQVDPTTLDSANGNIGATGSGNIYNISLSSVSLSQAPLNTGFADLNFQFTVEFVLGAGGLSAGATLFPNFLVSGTVQNTSTSYAKVTGAINYIGVDAAGVSTLWDTVNYNWLNNTPGPFSNLPVNGTPTFGNLPALGPNSFLDLVGNLTFEVDPATLNVETVPEPGTMMLVGMSVVGLLAAKRRK